MTPQEEFIMRLERLWRGRDIWNLDLWLATCDRTHEADWVEALAGWMMQHRDDAAIRWMVPAMARLPYGWHLLCRAESLIDRIARGLAA